MMKSGGRWRVTARVAGAEAALAAAALLDALTGAVSAFETPEDPAEWRVEAYPAGKLLDPGLEVRLALAAAGAGGALLDVAEEHLPERDWLAENRNAFPPLRLAGFWIRGSHVTARAPAGMVEIEIDAASAFGTGEHASTAGCLRALDWLAKRGRPGRPLDIGTGSGILAIAAAKLLHRKVLASDIDREAVRVARHHVRRNGLAGEVRVIEAPGYGSRSVGRSRYDLVFANILARPLGAMAPDLARALMPGGRAILSGLLRRQEAMVVRPHRAQGLTLERRFVTGEWSTLVLRSGRNAPA